MALPDYAGLAAGTTRTSGIAAAVVQNAANYLGSAIDNATNLDDFADIEVVWAYGTNPTASKSLKLYLLYAHNGTNYEDGAGDGTGTGDVDPLASSIKTITPPVDTSTHRLVVGDVPLLPLAFKVLFANVDTGQTATVTVNIKTRKASQITD